MPSTASPAIRVGLAAACCFAVSLQPASAQVWTDWTSMTPGAVGTAQGYMPLPGGDVGVSYAGQVLSGSQTTCGTSWLASSYPAYDGVAIADPPGSYLSPLPCDFIQVNSVGAFSFTFARPVRDLFMAFVSVGQVSVPVSYTFSSPFTLIDEGRGPWGDGSFAVLPGNVLEGREGHGVVRFPGVHSTLEWTVANPEHWHGFTVGALPASTVPEPGTIVLLGSGLIGVMMVGRRRRRREGA